MNPFEAALKALGSGTDYKAAAKAAGVDEASDDFAKLREKAIANFLAGREEVKYATVTGTLKADDGEDGETPGHVMAVFTTFNIIDREGDVILPGAVKPKANVPFVWAHNWMEPALGKGSVKVDIDRAIWDGNFFMKNSAAANAFETIKGMGEAQEYSWGFRILDAEVVEDDNSPWGFKRNIKDTEIFEVSGALIGMNPQTYTLLAKSAAQVPGADALKGMIGEAVAAALKAQAPLGEPEPNPAPKGKTFDEEIAAALAAVASLVERAQSLADERTKDGRTLGDARRQSLADAAKHLGDAADALSALTTEQSVNPELLKLWADSQRLMHSLGG